METDTMLSEDDQKLVKGIAEMCKDRFQAHFKILALDVQINDLKRVIAELQKVIMELERLVSTEPTNGQTRDKDLHN